MLNEHIIVDKYVVIDDLDLKNEETNSHLVRINEQVGITKDDARRIIDMINLLRIVFLLSKEYHYILVVMQYNVLIMWTIKNLQLLHQSFI